MKLSKRNQGTFFAVVVGSIAAGTLGWELLARVLSYAGIELSLSVGPVGFDIAVLSVYMEINPGSFLGLLGGIVLFRKL
jgi:hypothetical protein